jgi:hypothetical protein
MNVVLKIEGKLYALGDIKAPEGGFILVHYTSRPAGNEPWFMYQMNGVIYFVGWKRSS